MSDDSSNTLPFEHFQNTIFDVVPVTETGTVTIELYDLNYPCYSSFDSTVSDGSYLAIDNSIVTFKPIS